MTSGGKDARIPRVDAGGLEGTTELLWARGYNRLRDLARHYLSGEVPDHTLVPTALVHEAFLKIANQGVSKFRDRRRFFAYAARTMRNVLVDHARRRRAVKRGGDRQRLPFDVASDAPVEFDCHLIALHEALAKLESLDPQLARIVDLRFFGGLTMDETAQILNVAPITIDRAWKTAKSWLHLELKEGT